MQIGMGFYIVSPYMDCVTHNMSSQMTLTGDGLIFLQSLEN